MSNDRDIKPFDDKILEGNQNLGSIVDAVQENVYDLKLYDGKIDAFKITPDSEIGAQILDESSKLFNSKNLEIATDPNNLSLGIENINSKFIDKEAVLKVNEGLTNLANTSLGIEDSIAKLDAVNDSWAEKYDPLQFGIDIDEVKGSAKLPNLDINAHEIATDALYAESTYLNLDSIKENISSNFEIDATNVIENFAKSFENFSQIVGVENELSAGFNLEDDLLTLSSKGLVNSSSILDQLAVNDNFELPFYEEKLVHFESDIQKTEGKLEEMLRVLDPEFLKMLKGAERALDSNNPDRARHFGTSLRELFNHVLRQLAPAPKVEDWTNDENHYHNGRPTRRARILYISRKTKSNSFKDYLHSDVKSVLEFTSLFHGITHKKISGYSKQQLRGMLTKMRGTLHLLISTSNV